MVIVRDRGSSQHGWEIQEVRRDYPFSHRLQKVSDASASNKRIRGGFEFKATQNAVDPRQQAVFRTHVAQFGKSEYRLRNGKLVEDFTAVFQVNPVLPYPNCICIQL